MSNRWTKQFLFFVTTGCTLLFPAAVLSAQEAAGRLTVSIHPLKNTKGNVVVYLYREMDELPKKPFRQESGVIVNDSSVVVFERLLYGSYAAIFFQDENGNGILDHRLFLPAEPMGFSNHWKLTLFSGMPDFQKLRFTFTERSSVLILGMDQ